MADEARLARQASSPVGELAIGVTGLAKTSSLLREFTEEP